MDAKFLVFIGFLALAAIFIIIAGVAPAQIIPYPLKIIFVIISMLADVLAFSSRYYSYLLIPILQQRKKDIILSNEYPYRLSGTEDSIITKREDYYVATIYVTIPLYRSATEMKPEEKLDFGKQISRLVSINKDPIRYTTQLDVMNKDVYIQSVRDAINQCENDVIELTEKSSEKSPLKKELDRAKGKTEMWRNIEEHVSDKLSFELVSYASVSAEGNKEFEAISFAQQKARDLISGISSTLGVTPSIVTGNELIKLVEPEQLMPVSESKQILNKGGMDG